MDESGRILEEEISSKGDFDTFETLDADDFEQFDGKIDDEEPDVLLGCAQYREVDYWEERDFCENEENQLSYDGLIKLAKFYNTSIDYILGLTNIKEPYPKSR